MNNYRASTIEAAGKSLILLTANLQSGGKINDVEAIARSLFAEVAPFLTHRTQVLCARDLPQSRIEVIYPPGKAGTEEIYIAVPSWPADRMHLTDTIAHELHHFARFQTIGYPKTLGEAVTSEGLASYFALLRSRWQAPWLQAALSDKLMKKIKSAWDTEKYDHDEWFLNGKFGRWTGYSVGCYLARKVLENRFDFRSSLQISAGVFKKAMT